MLEWLVKMNYKDVQSSGRGLILGTVTALTDGDSVKKWKFSVSNTLFYLLDSLYRCVLNVPYRNCIYSRLPQDEPPGSKHVVDIKIKN